MEKKVFSLLGINFAVVDQKTAIQLIDNSHIPTPGYLCLANTYVVVLANRDHIYKEILNSSALVLPDGKPVEFLAKIFGIKGLKTVSGYWLLDSLLKSDKSHYFYGTDHENLTLIKNKIEMKYPQAKTLGYKAPPMIHLKNIENNPHIERDIMEINSIKPDIIWIGLSSPKQDILMNLYHKHLDSGLMIGVGAVFNYFSGKTRISPEWIKRIGFRWLFRLWVEPRLIIRYIYGNTIFILLIFKSILLFCLDKIVKTFHLRKT